MDTKDESTNGWEAPDAGTPGWNAKATEQLAEYEQASRDRVAGIKAKAAEREAKADRVTFYEERDVTDPAAPAPAPGRVQADPEQARDEAAGPERSGGGDAEREEAQAGELEEVAQVEAEPEAEDPRRAAARAEIEAAFGHGDAVQEQAQDAAPVIEQAQDAAAVNEDPRRAAARAEIEAAFGRQDRTRELER